MVGLWFLIVGFALPVVLCAIYETMNPASWLQYILTIYILIFYSIPFILIIIITAIFIKI